MNEMGKNAIESLMAATQNCGICAASEYCKNSNMSCEEIRLQYLGILLCNSCTTTHPESSEHSHTKGTNNEQ